MNDEAVDGAADYIARLGGALLNVARDRRRLRRAG
jgi:hypothetical protein